LSKLNSQSIEILIGAIALHDLGMFIQRVGLKRLIFIEYKDEVNKCLNKLTWKETWENFYMKARRYNDRQLERLFGDDATHVEKLPLDDIPKNETKNQRLLYGEFICQNHHHLAFHIADKGFPGNKIDIDLFEKCDCDEIIKKIIGLVAQSHGMKLRDTEEFLQKNEIEPESEGIPIFYLMAVLRIADSLHIGKDRASEFKELTDEISSPESIRQLRLNQAIHNSPSFNENDKYEDKYKSVNINATPNCSSTYVDVKEVLHNIQQELDDCWAVLVENYGYDYELSIHRLKSNLYDEKRLSGFNDQFLTRKVILDVNPDIVKDLLGPLYNNNPSYGVRELIQNAVDACNERTAKDNVDGKIFVRIDTEKNTFEIEDNGIGMNEEILVNYFLVAGSSYRDSDAWREQFTTDDVKAKITRIGHFGIGALAVFLIGDKITVTTKHIDDEFGFQFDFSRKPEILNVKRLKGIKIGTKIEIKMNKNSMDAFDIDKRSDYSSDVPFWIEWHRFSKPKVCYHFNKKKYNSDILIDPEENVDNNGWYDIKSNIFHNIKLRFAGYKSEHEIIVNGIIVKNVNNNWIFSIIQKATQFLGPNISLIDRDNNLELNLNRTEIIVPINSKRKNELKNELNLIIEETFKYYLANLLAIQEEDIMKLAFSKFDFNRIILNDKGYTLFSPFFIYYTSEHNIYKICINMSSDSGEKIFDKNISRFSVPFFL
jgi:hypothetical protein